MSLLGFLKTWGDKTLLTFLIIGFTGVAVWGFYLKNGDMASFSSDLAKQLVSAILTLLVASRVPWTKQDGTNGKPHEDTTTTTTTTKGTTT